MMEKPNEVMLFVSSSFTECAISSLVCTRAGRHCFIVHIHQVK